MSSSESDIEMLATLSDWDDSDEDTTDLRYFKQRIDYTTILNNSDFQLRFRLDKTTVEQLLIEIQPNIRVTGSRNFGISPLHQLLLALRFYALGTMLLSVGEFIGVSKSSACRIVRDISCAIGQLYNKYIIIHNNTEDRFYDIAQFPRVLGALDCTHIKIHSPRPIREEFRNHKGYFSLNVQAVCDANLMLMNVVAQWPGSTHNATIFNHSELKAHCESGTYGNRWLLGDKAYPSKPYLLTPLCNPVSKGEQLYNESHKLTRQCIERCIGVWRKRFPVISQTIRLGLPSAYAVIIATAVLHNICRINNLDDVSPEVEIPILGEVPVDNSYDNEVDYTEREKLIYNYFNNLE